MSAYEYPSLNKPSANISAARQNLRRLSNIRYIALGGQILALYYFTQIYPLGLPIGTICTLVIGFAIINLLTHWRSHWAKTISEMEFGAHLLVDISALTVLLYFSGGATNPFISYYLVPISIAAISLPMAMTWAITGLSILAYSALLIYYQPFTQLAPHHGNPGFNLHIIGMWINFALSAGLITYFVVRMAAALRMQEAELSTQREEQMQDEQLLAIATLAAGAAHELGTPLNTMKLLIDNLAEEVTDREQQEDVATLNQQIARCRKTLQSLVNAASIIEEGSSPIPVASYVEGLLDNWLLIRPDIKPDIKIASNSPAINACFHPVIQQSLLNLLNNAAEASPEQVKVTIHWDALSLYINIRDYGPGLSSDQIEKMGKPIPSGKPGGLGLGLFLTHSSLNRHGGRVSLSNADGGLLTSVVLPLKAVCKPGDVQ
jgi:two-component system sensor histidine kinase RegB